MSKIGVLCDIQKKFQWKINILQLSDKDDIRYESPDFYFAGSSWNIWIYPNGETEDNLKGWIGLYLVKVSTGNPVTLDYSFTLQTVDGKTDFNKKGTEVFKEVNLAWGHAKFILRSRLMERKSELLSSGVLTINVILKDKEFNDVDGIQGPKKVCTDAFSQTEEEAGIEKLTQDLREISLSGSISDVVLNVEGQEFRSHRCILAARSPVFMAMLTHDTEEKQTGVVNIEDVDQKTFPDFLNYVYTGNVDITPEKALKLYSTADRYQIKELREKCLSHILRNISVDNFCDTFTLSLHHDEENLKKACIQFFSENPLDIVKTSKWKTFLRENPEVGNDLCIKQLELNK